MKFGMLLPTLGPLATGASVAEKQLTIAQKAEALGFDSIWLADHKETYEELKKAAAKAGRDMKSLQISIGPAYIGSVDQYVEEMKKYQDLGFDTFFAPVGFWGTDLQNTLGVMEEFARKAEM